jgi:hypothetical protein
MSMAYYREGQVQRMSMAYYRVGQVQRRVQKTIGSGNQPTQDDKAMNADTTATCQDV